MSTANLGRYSRKLFWEAEILIEGERDRERERERNREIERDREIDRYIEREVDT